MPLSDPIFGQILGPPDVEFAVLNTLEAWVPYMLRVLERRHGFPAGTLTDPTAYSGGIDFDSWDEDHLPAVIARVQPRGEADRSAVGYSQWFEVEVAGIVGTEIEDESRIRSAHLGTAVMAALTQHGGLDGLASRTDLISAPSTDFPDAASRLIVRSRTLLQTYVTGLIDDKAGTRTSTPPESPHIPDDPDVPSTEWPAHSETNVRVTLEGA